MRSTTRTRKKGLLSLRHGSSNPHYRNDVRYIRVYTAQLGSPAIDTGRNLRLLFVTSTPATTKPRYTLEACEVRPSARAAAPNSCPIKITTEPQPLFCCPSACARGKQRMTGFVAVVACKDCPATFGYQTPRCRRLAFMASSASGGPSWNDSNHLSSGTRMAGVDCLPHVTRSMRVRSRSGSGTSQSMPSTRRDHWVIHRCMMVPGPGGSAMVMVPPGGITNPALGEAAHPTKPLTVRARPCGNGVAI